MWTKPMELGARPWKNQQPLPQMGIAPIYSFILIYPIFLLRMFCWLYYSIEEKCTSSITGEEPPKLRQLSRNITYIVVDHIPPFADIQV